MTQDLVDQICGALPGAQRAAPGSDEIPSWKVGGKMFACLGHNPTGVSVKTQSVEDASLLIEMGRANRAKYFHKSWVNVPWGVAPDDELRDRLETSYKIVRASLPKKLRDTLDPF